MKKFSKKLFEKHDGKARTKAIKYLNEVGYLAHSNPNKYDPDVVVMIGDETKYVEVEVKTAWSGPEFPYPTLHIAGRKMKYAIKFAPLFMVFEKNLDYAACVSTSVLLKHYHQIFMSNKYAKNEMFIDIPIDVCIIADMNDPDMWDISLI